MTPSDRISFRPPFTSVSTSQLTLRNPTQEALAFKIKTTAPKRYCVRPNAGFVGPNESSEIKVMLQPGSIEERHKFQVQSIIVPANYNELGKDEQAGHWSSPDSAAMCSKLTCEFVTQTTPENAETTGRINKDSPPDYSTVQSANVKTEVKSEYVHQHQQNLAEGSPKAPRPKQTEKPTSNNEAEEIRRLKAELQEALKKIEMLSSSTQPSHSDQSAEQQKNLLIYLFIAFMLGFFISALI